jgi:hypothetical protein
VRYAGFPEPPPASFEGRYFCACGMVEFLLPDVPHVKVTTYQAAAEHSPLGCFSVCEECKAKTDPDGYCDPCAEAAVERYKAENGGIDPMEALRRRGFRRWAGTFTLGFLVGLLGALAVAAAVTP